MFDLFVEPRLNVSQNNRWERNLFSSVDVVPTVTAGLSYNLYAYGMKHGSFEKTVEFRNENFVDHMFYGLNIGAAGILHKGLRTNPLDRIGPMASLYLGKWFTAASGVRFDGRRRRVWRFPTRLSQVRSCTTRLFVEYQFDVVWV